MLHLIRVLTVSDNGREATVYLNDQHSLYRFWVDDAPYCNLQRAIDAANLHVYGETHPSRTNSY
jgi:hypothetical protein